MHGNFDDGVCYICDLMDVSKPGLMAKQELHKIARHWFENRMVGFRRQYAAKGANQSIDMLIRIHYEPKARIGTYALMGNGEQYRIDAVATGYDTDTHLRFSELTLSRLEDFYDVYEIGS